MSLKLLVTTNESAALVGTTPAAIRRLGTRGELVRVHEGSAMHRYRGRDVAAWMARNLAGGAR